MKHRSSTTRTSAITRGDNKRTSRRTTQPEPRKSHLTRQELAEFEQILLRKRRELVGDMGSLHNEVVGRNSPGVGDEAFSAPIDSADLASDTGQREFACCVMENKQEFLRGVDDALQRIRNGTYGICEATKKVISKARLRAIPWTRYCIQYARNNDQKHALQ